ncbi:MAG: TIGR02444 family protein [Pararhodobacter sp.]|nr:TIGR02444 family protein [Pararhodobacter sp.]
MKARIHEKPQEIAADGSDIWAFAQSFCAKPGIASLCLRLQAEGGADVMLLIAHCYDSARQDAPLSTYELQALRAHIADWRRRAVLPLRAIRVDLRDTVAHTRKSCVTS